MSTDDTAQEPERAWLVEWKALGYGPQWWGFNWEPGKHGMWCNDANNAIRFSRKEDAERMRLHVIAVADLTGHHEYEASITVTEHEWVSAACDALAQVCIACGKPWDGQKCCQVDNDWPHAVCTPVDASPTQAAPAEPDMRHPKIQALIGAKARREIELQLVEQLLDEGPDCDLTSLDMEYWHGLHDKLRDRLSAAPTVAELLEALELVVAAWESLPGGAFYSPRQIEKWLADDMYPGINAARGALASYKGFTV